MVRWTDLVPERRYLIIFLEIIFRSFYPQFEPIYKIMMLEFKHESGLIREYSRVVNGVCAQ